MTCFKPISRCWLTLVSSLLVLVSSGPMLYLLQVEPQYFGLRITHQMLAYAGLSVVYFLAAIVFVFAFLSLVSPSFNKSLKGF